MSIDYIMVFDSRMIQSLDKITSFDQLNDELNKLRMDINRRYSINENNTKYDLNNMSLIDKRELQHNLIDTLSRYNNIQVGGSINYNYIEEKIQPITELSPEIKQLHQSYDNQIIGLQNEINALLNN